MSHRSATARCRMSCAVADSGTVQALTSLAMAPKPRLTRLSAGLPLLYRLETSLIVTVKQPTKEYSDYVLVLASPASLSQSSKNTRSPTLIVPSLFRQAVCENMARCVPRVFRPMTFFSPRSVHTRR